MLLPYEFIKVYSYNRKASFNLSIINVADIWMYFTLNSSMLYFPVMYNLYGIMTITWTGNEGTIPWKFFQ